MHWGLDILVSDADDLTGSTTAVCVCGSLVGQLSLCLSSLTGSIDSHVGCGHLGVLVKRVAPVWVGLAMVRPGF